MSLYSSAVQSKQNASGFLLNQYIERSRLENNRKLPLWKGKQICSRSKSNQCRGGWTTTYTTLYKINKTLLVRLSLGNLTCRFAASVFVLGVWLGLEGGDHSERVSRCQGEALLQYERRGAPVRQVRRRRVQNGMHSGRNPGGQARRRRRRRRWCCWIDLDHIQAILIILVKCWICEKCPRNTEALH